MSASASTGLGKHFFWPSINRTLQPQTDNRDSANVALHAGYLDLVGVSILIFPKGFCVSVRKISQVLVAVAALALLAPGVLPEKKGGQSASIQHGLVSNARQVDLTSKSAVPAGALIGGGLGLVSAAGKSAFYGFIPTLD